MVSKNWKSRKMSFNERCYTLLKKVPKGKVTTYKALAQALNTKAYQAVGNAMNKNPYAFAFGVDGRISSTKQNRLVPCHRCIKSSGEIGGFASGQEAKIKMLKAEGIEIREGKINLKKYSFNLN